MSNSKGSATIDGVTYSNALKMGSSASVTFSIYEPMVMTLYFVSSEGKSLYLAHGDTKKSIGIDATNIVTERLESIGEYKLTKKSGESYLVYIALSPIHTTAIGKPCNGSTTGAGMMFNINGQKVNGAWNGIMIIDGKKFVAK